MRKYILSLTFLFILTPVLAFGQFTGYTDPTITEDKSVISFTNDASINANLGNGKCNLTEKTLKGYVNYLGCAAQVFVIPFIFTIAVVAFVFGVVMMISNPGSEEATTKGKTFILWGIIGFFVIASMYALVAILRNTAQFGQNVENDATPYNQLKDKVQNLK